MRSNVFEQDVEDRFAVDLWHVGHERLEME
jgi:hypothetical protein